MRELRTELKRSTAPAAALGVLVIYGLVLTNRPTWHTGWPELSTSLGSFLILLLPVAAAAGAWQGGRERRAQTEELVATVSRSSWRRTVPPLAAVVIAVVATLALAVAVTGASTGPGNWQRQVWPAVAAVVDLLALAAAVSIGAGLGRIVRSNLTAPLLMCLLALGFVLLYGRGSGRWPTMFNPSMKPPQDLGAVRAEFLQVRPVISAGQAVWLTGLLLTGALLAAATTIRGRLIAVAPAAVGALLAVPFFVAPGGYDAGPYGRSVAYRPDAQAMTLYCAPGAPLVCGAAVHEQQVRRAAAPVREVLGALQRLPGAPTRAVADSQYLGRPVPDDVLPLSAALLGQGKIDRVRTLAAAGLGRHPDCYDAGPAIYDQIDQASALAGAWLLGLTSTETYGHYESLDQQLRSFERLPPDEQVHRMGLLRQALRQCRPGAMKIITGAGS
jgi:hypothetical protein